MKIKAINISIIAHVDHGKTTLLNSLVNFCKNFYNYQKNFFFKKNYFYTIKFNFISIITNNTIINFIDCPGHFDFVNEIYKIIFFSEICLILIDLIKGIESQTMFCYNLSKKFNKKIFIFINKIDLFLKYKNVKNKFFFFNKKQKINYIITKYSIGIEKFFFKIKKTNYNNNKLFFVLDKINNVKYGKIFLIKTISGVLKIGDILRNKFEEKIILNKIGILIPKIFYIKKTFNNSLHFLFYNNKLNSISYFYNLKIKNKIKKFKKIVYYNLFIEKKYYFIKLLENDCYVFVEKKNSFFFGENYFLGFIGNFQSEIFFTKLQLFSKFWITNPIFYFLLNNKNKWYYDIDKKNKENIFEQIVFIKLFILKKNFFLIIYFILNVNIYKIKIVTYSNLIILIFYTNIYKIINNFFIDLNKKNNGFIFFEFFFHHFLKSKLFFVKISINNIIVEEISLIYENNLLNNCNVFYEKICKNINKFVIDIVIKFLLNKKIFLTKKIFCYKKNVIEKCYGGDITRKIKLLQKQKKGKFRMKKLLNYCIDKKIIINFIKNEFSNI